MEGETNGDRDRDTHLEQDICIHIFTVSSAMVGVCLISCLLSYWALRSRSVRRMHRLEKVADATFIIAMIGMVIICALITYNISAPPRAGAG